MKDYYKRRFEIAKLELELVKEAIAERLHKTAIVSDDFALYSDLLKEVESSLKSNEELYLKAESESVNTNKLSV